MFVRVIPLGSSVQFGCAVALNGDECAKKSTGLLAGFLPSTGNSLRR